MSWWSKHITSIESDYARVIREMKEKDPGVEQRQQEGFFRLWDKEPISLDEQRRIKESTIKQQAYVYLSKSK